MDMAAAAEGKKRALLLSRKRLKAMSQKILVISQLPPPVHGSTVMTQRFMDSLRSVGYDAVIVQKDFSRRMEDVGRYSVVKFIKAVGLCTRLTRSIRKDKPILCFLFVTVGWSSFIVDSMLAAILRVFRTPYVLYFHTKGYRKLEFESFFPLPWLVRATLSNAPGGIVLGERLKEDVDAHIRRDRLFVLPNAIPDEGPGEPRKPHQGLATVLFLANLVRTKGPMEFLRMAKAVIAQHEGVHFIMAGKPTDPSVVSDMQKFIQDEGLSKFIDVIGPVYGEKKAAVFKSADVFVLPTSKDAFPLVNIEAMQWGLPVISTREGAIPETVRDGVNGYIVDPHDVEAMSARVLELLRDTRKGIEMGQNGRDIYEREYSLGAYEKNLKRAIEFFLQVNDGRKKGCSK
jgi:glycosyltransferase involved in cell wall biosynthesis